MAQQVDILHPLATLKWERCFELGHPEVSYTYPVHATLLGDQIYLLNFGKLWKYTYTADIPWEPMVLSLDLPTFDCAFTTYQSKLVFVGGEEKSTGKATADLFVCDEDLNWLSLLPPMPTARMFPSAVNLGNPECLVVTSRLKEFKEESNRVEVLIEEQWSSVGTLPRPVHNFAVRNGRLYFNAAKVVYYCNLSDICHRQDTRNIQWNTLQVPEYDREINHPLLASWRGQLIIFNDENIVFAYSSLTESWLPVGDFPYAEEAVFSSLMVINLPDGDSLVLGIGSSLFMYRISATVSPYDPYGGFSMNSLYRLEGVGIKVVTSLVDHLAQLQSAAGIVLSEENKVDRHGKQRSAIKCLEILIDQWEAREGRYPPTWRSLLEVISQRMNLKGLSQQIEDYMTGKTQYLDAYRQVLATQDSVQMWFFKVILLGAPRLGKTTVRRRLTGEIDDIFSSGEAEQPSTGAVESGHSVVIRNLSSTTALVTPTEWLVTKDLTDETRMFLQYFHSLISEKKATQSKPRAKEATPIIESTVPKAETSGEITETVEKSPSAPSSQQENTVSVPESSVPESLTTSSDHRGGGQSQFMSEIADMFRKALGPKHWKEFKHLFTDTAFIKMEDTGGQPEFMDMLPALTIGPALYLLFCKLTDELQSNYKVSYLSPSGESTLPRESTYTVEEIFFKALASVMCSSSTSESPVSSDETTSSTVDQLIASCNKSVAYIVGTHKDLVSEQQIDEFDDKLQQCIRPTAFFQDNIVQFSSEQRMVLPIDNMRGGKNEVFKIRKILEEALKKHFQKLSIPASWLVLSLCLRKREERTASLETVLQLAGELGISEKEAMVALWFLHHYAGVLMYFPNLPELKGTVICDNQVVYDSATKLIINSFKFGSVGKAASEWFSKTGQFSLEDIRKATASVLGDYIPLEKLVKLLEHLNVLASFVQSNLVPFIASCSQSSKRIHFMPCVLQNATHQELARFWDKYSAPGQLSIAPLFIRYKCGFVPIGVFPAMIASLSNNKALKLKVEGLKKNRVQFRIGRDFDTVTLISQPKYYAVHIARRQSAKTPSCPTHEVCATVRRLVESTLKTVASQMNYNFTVEYQLSFECPSHPGRDHLCVVDSDDPSPYIMSCLANMDDPEPVNMSSHHLIWFGECLPEHENIAKAKTDLQSLAPTTISFPADCSGSFTQAEKRPTIISASPGYELSCQDQPFHLQQQLEEPLSINAKPKLHQLSCLTIGGKQFKITQNVGVDWKQLGLVLEFDYNLIKAIERDAHYQTSECCLELLHRWLEGEGCRPITWKRLIQALKDADHAKIATQLEHYFAF